MPGVADGTVTNPADSNVVANCPVTFTCALSEAFPAPTVRWFIDNTEVTNTARKFCSFCGLDELQ